MISRLLLTLLALLLADSAFAACPVANDFVAGQPAIADDVDENFLDLITCVEALQAIDPIIATEIDTSAELRGILTDESGTGALLFAGGALGTPASGVATNLTGVATNLTAGAGDSATSFFSTGTIEDARIPTTITRDSELFAYTVSASAASGNCTVGDLWLKTSATATLYACTATNTWTAL